MLRDLVVEGEKNRISLVDLEHNHMASRHGGPG